MFSVLSPFVSTLPRLTWVAALDIVLVAIIIYQFIQIVRGRRAAHMLSGLLVLVIIYLVAVSLKLDLLRTLLATLAPYTAFAMIVMFQSEIRRLLARLGKQRLIGFGSRLQRRETVDEILLALQQLAQQKIGGLIVVEREIGLRTFVESGVPLDAAISRDLLLALFHPGAAMHDGAVIIQGDRIAAAACFLPLTMNPELLRYLGTRHRAAIGVTEETDCISLIVSEETGRISIAQYGEIEYDVTLERVEEALTRRERPALKRAFGVAEERQA
jgi:diadenylate cyclase